MPLAADAKSVVSIRQSVISWVCGTGRRRAVARAKNRKRAVAAAAAKSKAGQAAKKTPATPQ